MSASKQKGTAFETLVLAAFRRHYPTAERRAMQGALDKGDLLLPGENRFIVECKNVKVVDLPGWTREAKAEAANAGVPYGVVLHKRRGSAKPDEQWVTVELRTFLELVNAPRGSE